MSPIFAAFCSLFSLTNLSISFVDFFFFFQRTIFGFHCYFSLFFIYFSAYMSFQKNVSILPKMACVIIFSFAHRLFVVCLPCGYVIFIYSWTVMFLHNMLMCIADFQTCRGVSDCVGIALFMVVKNIGSSVGQSGLESGLYRSLDV